MIIQSIFSDFLEHGTVHGFQREATYKINHSGVSGEATIRLPKATALKMAEHIFQSYGIKIERVTNDIRDAAGLLSEVAA